MCCLLGAYLRGYFENLLHAIFVMLITSRAQLSVRSEVKNGLFLTPLLLFHACILYFKFTLKVPCASKSKKVTFWHNKQPSQAHGAPIELCLDFTLLKLPAL